MCTFLHYSIRYILCEQIKKGGEIFEENNDFAYCSGDFCNDSIACSAADTMFDGNDITVCNLYTDLITAKVAINSSGNVYYSCQVRGKSSCTKISAYAYLQVYSNGSWSNVDCVTKTVNSSTLFVSDTYKGTSGSKYRCEVHVYSYSGSKYEYLESTSSTVKKP